MPPRKPPDLPLGYAGFGAKARVHENGSIWIDSDNDGTGDLEIDSRRARALAHWLTMAAEYAEHVAHNGLPDPREALALVVSVAEDTVRSGAAKVDALLGKDPIVFPTVPPSRPPPPIEVRRVQSATNECANCGHRHAGAEYAGICVGCPCPGFRPMPAPGDPFEADALEEFLDAQIGRTGALK